MTAARWIVPPPVTVERHANALGRTGPVASDCAEPERALELNRVLQWSKEALIEWSDKRLGN